MKRNYTKDVLEVVTTQRFGSKYFDVYGDIQNPLFVAVEVAEMIEIQNTTDLLKRVDDDEKLTYVISRAGQKREMNMLTEFGVYEVLSQSRKPLAKEFKKSCQAHYERNPTKRLLHGWGTGGRTTDHYKSP